MTIYFPFPSNILASLYSRDLPPKDTLIPDGNAIKALWDSKVEEGWTGIKLR